MSKSLNAIAILGGSLNKDENNAWHTTTFKESAGRYAFGDRLRVVAASYLYQDDKYQLLIALGGKGQQLKNVPEAPLLAAVIKKELIELGIPAEKIIEENKSNNTYEQLQELKKIIHEFDLQKTIII